MNIKQKIVIWASLCIFAWMGVYPPWLQSVSYQNFTFGPQPGVYHWIFSPPGPPEWVWRTDSPELKSAFAWQAALDIPRLLIQWAVVCFVAAGMFCTLADRRTEAKDKN